MRNRIQIVCIVVIVGGTHIHRVLFQLNKEERDTIDETDDIRPSVVDIPVNLHLLHREKAVLRGIREVNHHRTPLLLPAVRLLHRHGDAVADEEILLLVHL